MTETNHELNVKAAEAVGWKWKGKRLKEVGKGVEVLIVTEPYELFVDFSPATSIKDAMGLLDALPDLIGWWTVSYCMVHIHSGEDEPRFSVDVTVGYGMDTGRTKTQAITEAFVAAMEASDGKTG